MLSRWLPARNADCDYWWQLTGPQLEIMLSEAGYSVKEQYEAMLFHYYAVVPGLGPRPPPSGKPRWKSVFAADGTPLEYSWKWNTATGAPDVRYTVEPIGHASGTSSDPLNQETTKKLLSHLTNVLPSLDLTWFHHFASALYDADNEGYAAEIRAGAPLITTMFLAFEFLKKELVVKAYFAPRKLGQTGLFPLDDWVSVLRGIGPGNASLDEVAEFLKTDPEGLSLNPFALAIDCVKPSKSRMKLYFQSPRTCFNSVRQIMTLGGKIHGVEGALEELHELIKLVMGLDKDFPSSQEVPTRDEFFPAAKDSSGDLPIVFSGYLYYFDIAPGSSMPDIKFYIPICRYGRDDRSIARALIQWMKSRGRGQYTENYKRILESLGTHRPLDAETGVQTFISCIFQKGELSVTSYLAPQAFHPERMSKYMDDHSGTDIGISV